jgi:hypothetical protein
VAGFFINPIKTKYDRGHVASLEHIAWFGPASADFVKPASFKAYGLMTECCKRYFYCLEPVFYACGMIDVEHG